MKPLVTTCLVGDVGTGQLPSALWVLPVRGLESLALLTPASVETGAPLWTGPLLWRTDVSSHHLLLGSYQTPSVPRIEPAVSTGL